MPPPWDPWAEAERRSHLVVSLDPLARLGGGGLYGRRGARAVILLDPDLAPVDLRHALAHELVHDEDPAVEAPPLLRAKYEALVDRRVVERLVPLDALDDWLRGSPDGDPVTAADVADAFAVPVAVARAALERRRARGPGRHPP